MEIQDIWTVNPTRSVSILSKKLDEAFAGRLERGGKRPLVWALYDTLKIELCIGILCQILSMCLLVLAPFVVRRLIEFAMDAYTSQHNNLPGPSLGKGMGLVIGLVTMQLVQSLSSNQAFYQSLIAGGELKAVLTPKLFSKAMRLSGHARAGNGTGYSDGRISFPCCYNMLAHFCCSVHHRSPQGDKYYHRQAGQPDTRDITECEVYQVLCVGEQFPRATSSDAKT